MQVSVRRRVRGERSERREGNSRRNSRPCLNCRIQTELVPEFLVPRHASSPPWIISLPSLLSSLSSVVRKHEDIKTNIEINSSSHSFIHPPSEAHTTLLPRGSVGTSSQPLVTSTASFDSERGRRQRVAILTYSHRHRPSSPSSRFFSKSLTHISRFKSTPP